MEKAHTCNGSINNLEEESVESLLVPNGGGAEEKPRPNRKVRFNDCSLTQIIEFQPSDSSDSEDEYADSCNWGSSYCFHSSLERFSFLEGAAAFCAQLCYRLCGQR